MSHEDIKTLLLQFDIPGALKSVHPFKVGHINETYISTWETERGEPQRYLHQKVNSYVFKDVPGVMANIERVISKIRALKGDDTREALTVIPSVRGSSFIQTPEGDFWRTYRFIEKTVAFELCTDSKQAFEAARVMGRFLRYLSDEDPRNYKETIHKFQNVPWRLQQLQEVVARDPEGRVKEVKREIDFILEREKMAGLVEELVASGAVPLRVTHSDPKFNNILFDRLADGGYGEGVAVVDLDTIMPGTSLYDFGDLARSVIIAAREDEMDLSKVVVNETLYEDLVRGYLHETAGVLTTEERHYLHVAPKLIALSLGTRFLTDYIAGDLYFKIHRLQHNLDRARTQLRIVTEMERAESRLAAIQRKF